MKLKLTLVALTSLTLNIITNDMEVISSAQSAAVAQHYCFQHEDYRGYIFSSSTDADALRGICFERYASSQVADDAEVELNHKDDVSNTEECWSTGPHMDIPVNPDF